MRLTCASDHLRSAVSTAQSVVVSDPKLTAYGGVLIYVTSDHARVIASDGDAAISVEVAATRLVPGQALLPPKPFGAYLNTIGTGVTVTVELEDDGDVTVSADGRPDYRFRPLTTTFPMPSQIRAEPIPVAWDGFAAALRGVRAAVTREAAAVQLVSSDGQLEFNTTDNYRLHRSTLPGGGFGPFTGLFALNLLDLVAKHEITSVAVAPKGTTIRCQGPQVTITLRTVELQFPNTDSVIGSVPGQKASISTRQVTEALTRLSTVADGEPVVCELGDGKLTLSVNNASLGSASEVVAVGGTLPAPFSFGIHGRFLIDVLNATTDQDVTVAWSAPDRPIYVMSRQPAETVAAIMPVKLVGR